jgi:blue copper oxidase
MDRAIAVPPRDPARRGIVTHGGATIGRRSALRFAAASVLAGALAACSRGTAGGGPVAPVGPLAPPLAGPRFAGPVQDVHLRLVAAPGSAEIVPGVASDVLRFTAEVLDGDPATVELGASYLGPTLHLREGQRVRVTFENRLEQESIVHWHGLVLPEGQDGQPTYAVRPGEVYEYDYVVADRPGTFWYHPHPHHHTGEQVYRGLAGLLVIHGQEPDLPTGDRDVAIVLQDRTVGLDGRLRYVRSRSDVMMGYVGETLTANGVIGLEVPVTRAPHRVRLLNGANARSQHLTLSTGDVLTVLATDGHLLPEALDVPALLLAPAQRADLWVDFSSASVGDRIELRSADTFVMGAMGGMGGGTGGMGPGSGGAGRSGGMGDGMGGDEHGLELHHEVAMSFVVVDSASEPGVRPGRLGGIVDIDPDAAVNAARPKEFVLSTRQGTHWIDGRQWEGRVASELETVTFGTVEVWDFVNASPMAHPMHLHGEAFRVLGRSWTDETATSSWDVVADAVLDDGLHDTVHVWPGQRVRIAVRFDKHRGYFPYHCHILEHEDDGMMRNFHVV